MGGLRGGEARGGGWGRGGACPRGRRRARAGNPGADVDLTRAGGRACHGGCGVLRVRAGRIDGRRGGPPRVPRRRCSEARIGATHLDLHLGRRALRLRVLRRLRPGQHREVLLHRRHGARAPRAPPRGRDASEVPRAERAPRTRRRSARGARAFAVAGAPRGNTDAAPTPEPRALECGARGATPRSTRVQPRGRNNVPSGASAATFQITARAASRLVAKSGADEALRWQNEKKGRFFQRANSLAIVRSRLAVGWSQLAL